MIDREPSPVYRSPVYRLLRTTHTVQITHYSSDIMYKTATVAKLENEIEQAFLRNMYSNR